jgi:hypothetical protein
MEMSGRLLRASRHGLLGNFANQDQHVPTKKKQGAIERALLTSDWESLIYNVGGVLHKSNVSSVLDIVSWHSLLSTSTEAHASRDAPLSQNTQLTKFYVHTTLPP